MARRVLVTGGAGFIGASLAWRLLADGHTVHVLVRPNSDEWRLSGILDDIQKHHVDLQDVDGVHQCVGEVRPDWIFHTAADGAYAWQTDGPRMIRTNILGTINLIESCLATGFEVLVNTGSSSEYGNQDHPTRETDLLEPNSTYAVTKAASTLFCQHVGRSRSLNTPTLRLYSVYGPFEHPDRLMPALITYGLAGKLPPLSHPDAAHDFIYIDDVVDAYLHVASSAPSEYGGIYNVGTGRQTLLSEVVDLARHVLDIRELPLWESMPDQGRTARVWVADPRKMERDFAWQPRHSMESGFRQMVEWMRSSGPVHGGAGPAWKT